MWLNSFHTQLVTAMIGFSKILQQSQSVVESLKSTVKVVESLKSVYLLSILVGLV
jgi:archaellum component FlaC